MHYIQGQNREQSVLFPQSLDQIISAELVVLLLAKTASLKVFKSKIRQRILNLLSTKNFDSLVSTALNTFTFRYI
jgi:hypothetical protein